MGMLCFDRGQRRSILTRVAANAHRYFLLLFASVVAVPSTHAAVCDPNALQGPYAFSLVGATTIGGRTGPVAVLGRLVFDDSGDVSGIASASFTGFVLGNPVTGKYEAHADCSVEWSLQDDSGGFQHFAGSMSAGGGHVAFRQTDPGGAQTGTLLRTMDQCSESSLAGEFHLTASGSTVDISTAVESERISLNGLLIADGAGGLFFAKGAGEPVLSAGTYDVQDDCFAELVLELPEVGNAKAAMHFRAILVEKGGALGIQTDPGTIVALQLVSR